MPLLLLLCGSCCKDKDFPFKFQFSAEWVFMLQILRFLLLFCPKKQQKSEKSPLSGNRKRCCHSAKMSSQNCRKKVRNSWIVWDETVASFTFLHATSNQDQSGLLCQNGNCKTDVSQQTGVCTEPSTRLHPLRQTLFLIWGKLYLHEWT